MIIKQPMTLVKIEAKSIEKESGEPTRFKMATLLDTSGNSFEMALDKDASRYGDEGTVNETGEATLDIFVEDKASVSKKGNPFIAKRLKMRCLDFVSKK